MISWKLDGQTDEQMEPITENLALGEEKNQSESSVSSLIVRV